MSTVIKTPSIYRRVNRPVSFHLTRTETDKYGVKDPHAHSVDPKVENSENSRFGHTKKEM